MRIGELARRAGVTADTIRFYEREELLGEPVRTPNGYRDYGEDTLEDLVFIRKAQALGLRLAGIVDSAVVGAKKGNREAFALLRRPT